MKIYDIISEAPSTAGTTSPGGIVIPAGSRTAAPATTTTPATPNAGPQISKARSTARAISSGAATTKASLLKGRDLVDKYILTKKIHGTVVTNRMAGALGTYLRIIKYLGFYDIAVQLWQQKLAIEGLVAEKQISKEDGQALIRQQYEKMAVAIMATGAFAKIIRMLKYIPVIKWFVRIAGGLATGATLGALGGPSLAIALATEVGLIFLTKFLQSEDGQKALAFWVVNIIDPGVVWLWNEGPGKIFGAWKTASEESQTVADKTIKGKDSAPAANSSNQGANPALATAPAAAAAAPAKAAIDATSTDQDPTLAATKTTIGDLLKPGDKKWGTGNAGFPKAAGGNVDPSEYKSKAPR